MKAFFGYLGRTGTQTLRYIGGMGYLFLDSLYWAFIAPFKGFRFRRDATFEQMVRVGVQSIPITFLVLLFVGMILAFQMARVLRPLGFTDYVADVVGIAVTRELGPLLTAIVMSGYVGAAIAAEVGTMKVSEEILALQTSALSPVRFLVVPRLFGAMIMFVPLTVLADLIGVLGGYLISTQLLDMSPSLYINRTIVAVKNKDIITGLIKSEAFAIIVSLVACYEGMGVTGGAEGVGKSTTASVVLSIVFIIIADCFFTALFYFIL
jgi:phospholipid/cholesterol/gamma-HCH transport system permease protein